MDKIKSKFNFNLGKSLFPISHNPLHLSVIPLQSPRLSFPMTQVSGLTLNNRQYKKKIFCHNYGLSVKTKEDLEVTPCCQWSMVFKCYATSLQSLLSLVAVSTVIQPSSLIQNQYRGAWILSPSNNRRAWIPLSSNKSSKILTSF